MPAVLLLVPVRNEVAALPPLLEGLAALTYQDGALTVVFVDDASTDGSRALCRAAASGRDNWYVLALPGRVGKAAALNAALARFPQGEVVAVYDADERPRPDALHQLVRPFADSQVGATSGRRAVGNPLAGPAATYATFEALVHQQVTQRAKDALSLAPAVLGSNCAYRRAVLAGVGGFRPGALLEDTDLTVRLARAGWRLRFVPDAVSEHAAPATVRGYWRQHTRWAGGFTAVAQAQTPSLVRAPNVPWWLRLELLAFAAGYLDRVALLVHLGAGPRPGILAASLLAPLLQVVAALHRAQAPRALWWHLPLLPLFFLLDALVALLGSLKAVSGIPIPWEERARR